MNFTQLRYKYIFSWLMQSSLFYFLICLFVAPTSHFLFLFYILIKSWYYTFSFCSLFSWICVHFPPFVIIFSESIFLCLCQLFIIFAAAHSVTINQKPWQPLKATSLSLCGWKKNDRGGRKWEGEDQLLKEKLDRVKKGRWWLFLIKEWEVGRLKDNKGMIYHHFCAVQHSPRGWIKRHIH